MRELKLSEYAAQICSALEANPRNEAGEAGPVRVTLNPEHAEYRMFISNVIRNAFCGSGSYASDTLFFHLKGLTVNNLVLSNRIDELSAKLAPKPKRTIQKSPKNGNIAKDKIEKAVKKVNEAAKP